MRPKDARGKRLHVWCTEKSTIPGGGMGMPSLTHACDGDALAQSAPRSAKPQGPDFRVSGRSGVGRKVGRGRER